MLSVFTEGLSRISQNYLVSCLSWTSDMTSGSFVECVQGNCQDLAVQNWSEASTNLSCRGKSHLLVPETESVILDRTSATIKKLYLVFESCEGQISS